MQKIFSVISQWFEKFTGKKLLYITPSKNNTLGKTAAWSELGFWYVGNVFDKNDIAYGVSQNGLVEKSDTKLVIEILSKLAQPVVYDIGANTGYYGILSATKFKATVHSFEPIPEHVFCIQESARINGVFDTVTTHSLALGNEEADMPLSLAGSGSTLTKNFLGENSAPVLTVPVKKLDSLSLPAPQFIKIDVEGYEWEVLQGAASTIKKYRPILFIEIAKSFSERNFIHENWFDIIHFFQELNYNIELNTSTGLIKIPDTIPNGAHMYLFTPNKF